MKKNQIHFKKEPEKKLEGSQEPPSNSPVFSTMAWTASYDMLSTIIVGTALGWAIDKYFLIKPWGMIIGFMLGAASGFVTIYRKLCRIGYGFNCKKNIKSKDKD